MPRFVRGLTLKLAKEGSRLKVRAEDGLSVEELAGFPTPCLVAVKLTVFVNHAVVLTGRDERGQFLLADPLTGRVEAEEPDAFARRFTGEAIALVP
jgi:ABC-type bacteriocin/lantibiotic exporter with double-glycine peptidase domain